MIPATSPERKILNKFSNTRKITNLGIFGGIPLIGGSIAFTAVASDRQSGSSNIVVNVGAVMITAFVATVVTSTIIRFRNRQKLYDAVNSYNK